MYIIPAVLDQMTTFPRNDSPIRSLCGTHRRLSLLLSTKHTHRAGYFYRRHVYKRHFFFIHPYVFAIMLIVDIPFEQIENYFLSLLSLYSIQTKLSDGTIKKFV